MKIISRNDARESGLKRFFTGIECKNNHVSERSASSGACLECDRLAKIEYRKRRPEKARETQRKSRVKHADQRRADNKRWCEENKEQLKKSKADYVKRNKEKVAAAKRKYYQENKEKCLSQSKKHYEENKEYYKNLSKIWRQNNKEKIRLNNRNRKEKVRAAGGSHSLSDVLSKLELQRGRCASCAEKIKNKNYHVDHIKPLALGGTNDSSNIQLLCPPCNLSKGAKPPEEYYAQRGFLL